MLELFIPLDSNNTSAYPSTKTGIINLIKLSEFFKLFHMHIYNLENQYVQLVYQSPKYWETYKNYFK